MKTICKCGMAYVLIGLGLVPLASLGHHSAAGRYDDETIMEIEGEVTRVRWINPHAYLTVESIGQNGERVVWELEGASPTTLVRSGIRRDSIKVGDYIKAAGSSPLTAAKEIFVGNILLPSGEELLMLPRAEPRWVAETTGDYSFRFATEGDASRPELGIFRIWSTTLIATARFNSTDVNSYPITEAARTAFQQFDPATDNPTRNCVPKGMPTIMDQPYPIEFVQDENDILLRIEEYDTLRTIHMNRNTVPSGDRRAPLGYSIGRWEGTTLVVTTTHLDWAWFNQLGIPQSGESVLVERFSPTDDGSRLDYELTVTDPINFTEPVNLEKYWLYIPGKEILPFDCALRD